MSTPDLDRNSIVVVCAADDNYAMPLAVTMRSVVENLKTYPKMTLFIIDGGIKEHNKHKILKSLNPDKCEIKWIPQPEATSGQFEELKDVAPLGKETAQKHVKISTYYRLLIPELLPSQITKAIYLDTDLIIVGDLGELWDMDIGKNYLLATQDICTPYISSPSGLTNYRELGLSPNYKYLTPGVLVINLEKWRADEICAKSIDYLKQYREHVRWHDADVLNGVLAGKWGELDPRWNQMPYAYNFSSWKDTPFSEEVYNSLIHNPYIIHFSTAAKPWNSREQHPFKHLFFHYLDMTAWSGWRFTIWRRLWRRLLREVEQFSSSISLPKSV